MHNFAELRIMLIGSSSSLTVRQRGKAFAVWKISKVPQSHLRGCDYSHVCDTQRHGGVCRDARVIKKEAKEKITLSIMATM